MKKFLLVCCICITLTIATICIQTTHQMTPENLSHNIKYLGLDKSKSLFKTNYTCLSSSFHCIDSSDCETLCDVSKFSFKCNENTCVPQMVTTSKAEISSSSSIYSNSNESANDLECDSKHGILKVLKKIDPLRIEWACVSTHSHIWNDDNTHTSYACNDGIITSDLTTSNFKLNNCECKNDMVLGFFESQPDIPRCFPQTQVNFLSDFVTI